MGLHPVLVDQHRDQHAGQQQQCHAQENDQQSACVPGGTMVMSVAHATFLSMAGSQADTHAA